MAVNLACSVPGDECSEPGSRIVAGMCLVHYTRKRQASKPRCASPECGKQAVVRGLCNRHFREMADNDTANYKRCSVETCNLSAVCKGLCRPHHDADRRRGHPLAPPAKRSNGAILDLIRATIEEDPDHCVFLGSRRTVKWRGRERSTSPVVLELAGMGQPPEGMEACHSCGNGHLGCITPRHLRYDTHKANHDDSIEHGTAVFPPNHVGSANPSSLLVESQVISIIALIAAGDRTDASIGKEFAVSASTIRLIRLGAVWEQIDRPWRTPPPSPGRRGELHGGAKLNPSKVRAIRASMKSDYELSLDFGVSTGCISAVRRRATWAWLPDEPDADEAAA